VFKQIEFGPHLVSSIRHSSKSAKNILNKDKQYSNSENVVPNSHATSVVLLLNKPSGPKLY
jgi:hypothetical protein